MPFEISTVREGSKTGWKEKFHCGTLAIEPMADATGSFGAGIPGQSCHALGQERSGFSSHWMQGVSRMKKNNHGQVISLLPEDISQGGREV